MLKRVEHMLQRFFIVVEKTYLLSSKIGMENRTLFPTSKDGLDYAFVREYYYHGLRFLAGIKKDILYLYLRAEYIGGYIPKRPLIGNLPIVEGYIPIFSEKIYEFEKCKYDSLLDDVFDYLDEKEGETPLNYILLAKDARSSFEEELNLLFANCENYFGPLIEQRDGRNPFSMRASDDLWLVRSYAEITLLFGKHTTKEKITKFFVFATSDIGEFLPIEGYKEKPNEF